MRKSWILLVIALGLGVWIILLPRTVAADGGANCRSLGNCGEVRDGLPSHLATNPLNWKCVKSEFRPMFPTLPVCPTKMIKMDKPVPMPITFGAPATPRVAGGK
ncbi:MAG: hypothetical protein HY713_12120 [candidate division NC10 bacterium]|nr:hypothetical protein [candidate division NC10 bacterium]